GPPPKPPEPTSSKRKYRRHPKRDRHAPVKPASAYVMFAHRVREQYQGQNLSFPEMAKIVGERWKNVPSAEKEAIEKDAAAAKSKYLAELEIYKNSDAWKVSRRLFDKFEYACILLLKFITNTLFLPQRNNTIFLCYS